MSEGVASETAPTTTNAAASPSRTRDARRGCQPSRRARTTAAATTSAIAASASVTSIEVVPTSIDSVGWYVAWRKRKGTATASASGSRGRPSPDFGSTSWDRLARGRDSVVTVRTVDGLRDASAGVSRGAGRKPGTLH